MNAFALALTLFVLLHLGVSATGLRARIVSRIGEGPYRGLFSVASLALLAWMVMGFRAMRADPFDGLNESLWWPPYWLHWLAVTIVGLGFLLGVAGLLSPGPTLAGFESRALAQAEPARGALRITRNPFLWGVALWAAGHLLANGERWAVMLFGALGAMVLFGTRSIDRKGAARDPDGWAKFAAATSNIPFGATVQRRNKLAFSELWWRLLIALVVFLAVGLAHRSLFGAAVFSTPR
ncbi:MAG: NnrU family protein [Proteobacteria bacterium]|nr:NnrU family protein [Pseudomonadota bacterium]